VNWLLLLTSLHVLAAITAVGANLTYAFWDRVSRADREHLGFVLRSLRLLDQRVANPAYAVVLVTGLLMVLTQGFSITLTWILIGLVVFVVVGALGGAVYAPGLRRQIAELDTGGPESDAYRAVAARNRGLGLFITVLVIAVVVVMVVKPAV
jgi:uncharacterized membrane protein